MHRFAPLLLIGLIAGLLVQTPAFAGVVFEVENIDHTQKPPAAEKTEVQIKGTLLNMSLPSASKFDEGEFTFRGDRQEIIVVDHERKSYFVMDKKTINSIAKQVGQAMSQVQEALKQVPEDQRAMVEQMMKENMPEAGGKKEVAKVTKTAEKANKHGYPCVKYEVSREGVKFRELWVTNWSKIEGATETRAAFENMETFFEEMLASFEEASGSAGFPNNLDDNPFAYMRETGGFPIVTQDFSNDGTLEGESIFRGSKRQTIDPDAFDPPSGYKRQTMPGGF